MNINMTFLQMDFMNINVKGRAATHLYEPTPPAQHPSPVLLFEFKHTGACSTSHYGQHCAPAQRNCF